MICRIPRRQSKIGTPSATPLPDYRNLGKSAKLFVIPDVGRCWEPDVQTGLVKGFSVPRPTPIGSQIPLLLSFATERHAPAASARARATDCDLVTPDRFPGFLI
jgi:hypothetical protein